jgi:hypothetical protein
MTIKQLQVRIRRKLKRIENGEGRRGRGLHESDEYIRGWVNALNAVLRRITKTK